MVTEKKNRPKLAMTPAVEKQYLESEQVQFDLKDLYDTRSPYSPEEKINAVMAYMVTGDSKKASRICNVPDSTIRYWKMQAEWWDNTLAECRKKKNEELDADLTRAIHNGIKEVEDRIAHGDYVLTKDGDLLRKPVNAKDLSVVAGVFFDKRALVRGDPTSRSESTTSEATLGRIKEMMEDVAKKTKEKDIVATVERDDS